MYFALCFWHIPQTRGIMPMTVLKYHVQKLMHVAIENKMSVADIKKILEDPEIKNKKQFVLNLKLRFIPKSIKEQYQKILYGIEKPQKPKVVIKEVLPAGPQGLIYAVKPAKNYDSDTINNIEYDNKEDYDSESTNAYYNMIDNRADNQHWLKLGELTNGNWLLPRSGVSYDSCNTFATVGCIGSGHWKNRNSVSDGNMRSMPDMISDGIHDKSGKGQIKVIPHMCDRLSCGICYKHGIADSANAIDNRVSAGVYLKDTSGSKMKRRIPLHGVVSVSKKSKTVIQYYRRYKGIELTAIGQLRRAKIKVCNTPYDKLRDPAVAKKEINKIMHVLKRAGLEGSTVIFHPFRFSKGLKIPRWSPHFHILYLGYTEKEDIKEFEENSSWIFHQVKRREGHNTLSTKSDIKRLACYLLSHAGVAKGHHVVKWFGDLHTNAFTTEKILSRMNTYDNQPLDTIPAINKILNMERKIHRIELQYMRDSDHSISLHDSDFNNLVHSKLLTFSLDSFTKFVDKKTVSDLDFETQFDKNVRLSYGHNNIDNPAISKSATLENHYEEVTDRVSKRDISCDHAGKVNVGFYTLSLRYYYIDKSSLEKCGYVIVVFDPNQSSLCPDCKGMLRLMIPINEIIPPDIIEEHVQNKGIEILHLVDSADYRYVNNDDIAKGVPYCRSDGIIKRQTGIAVLSADYNKLDFHSRIKQYDDYLDSLANYAKREVKRELRLSGYADKNPRKNHKLRLNIMRAYIMGLQDKSIISNPWNNSLWSTLSLIYTNIDQVPKIRHAKTKSQTLDIFNDRGMGYNG